MDTIVVISGYFNPLHTGHLDYIKGASDMGSKLIVIVNNDVQVELKRSTPFMTEHDRMRIVSAIKGVTRVVLSIDKDESVIQTLSSIYNEYSVDYFFDRMIFANGGDRREGNSPEDAYCLRRNLLMEKITTAYNVGGAKTQSSSKLIKESH